MIRLEQILSSVSELETEMIIAVPEIMDEISAPNLDQRLITAVPISSKILSTVHEYGIESTAVSGIKDNYCSPRTDGYNI